MTVHRQTLSALVLSVGASFLVPIARVGTAEAASISLGSTTEKRARSGYTLTVVVDDDPTNEVASVEVDVRSDAGSETLTLTESDAPLHGTAALLALPSEKSTVSLTLYDAAGGELMSFTGARIGAGSILFSGQSASTCDTSSRIGCPSRTSAPDVEVLAAELYPTAKGYALALDLAGADTYAVAHGTVAVSGGERTEVEWEAVDSAWKAETTLDHAGVIEVKAKTLDANGDTVENVRAHLGGPWLDGGEGVNALATHASPLTSLALSPRRGDPQGIEHVASLTRRDLLAVSEGWTLASHPSHAALEVAGQTTTIPANSYQRTRKRPELLFQAWDEAIEVYMDDLTQNPASTITISSGNFLLENYSALDLFTPVCSYGTCVVLVAGDQGSELSVTTYGGDAGKLPDRQTLEVVFHDESGAELASETISVEYDEEIVAVFANELEFVGDPAGLDASGAVSLLASPDPKGRQGTLAKGTLDGVFSTDGDGDLSLGGYGADEAARADASFAVVLGGSVECGGEGCEGDWAPPAVVYSDRIAAYVVGIRRVATSVNLKSGY